MNAEETMILLTSAALRDPRMKRTDANDLADMVSAWAEDLADVELSDAMGAMRAHYASSRDPLMIADVLDRVGAYPDPSLEIPDVTAERHAIEKQRALAAAGVSEEEFDAHAHDVEWLRAKFAHIEVGA